MFILPLLLLLLLRLSYSSAILIIRPTYFLLIPALDYGDWIRTLKDGSHVHLPKNLTRRTRIELCMCYGRTILRRVNGISEYGTIITSPSICSVTETRRSMLLEVSRSSEGKGGKFKKKP